VKEVTEFKDLVGRTIKRLVVDVGDENEVRLTLEDGAELRLYHDQDCCEIVVIESIQGDVTDVLGLPLEVAEEVVNMNGDESHTATWYTLATSRGRVTIRWYGSSNGYYSEGVSFGVASK